MLLDLCGLRAENAADLDGISLGPLLRGEAEDLPERAIVIHLQPDRPRKWNHSALIKGRWRLIKGDELYAGESDPGLTRLRSERSLMMQEFDSEAPITSMCAKCRRFWERSRCL